MAADLRHVLDSVAEQAARPSGFVRRRSKLSGPLFVQTTVLGWLKNPQASLGELTQMAATLGLTISPQGLDARFNQAAATLLRQVLEAAVARVVATTPVAIPILRRFSAVIIQDSSTIALPDALGAIWRGNGGKPQGTAAALKLQVRLDLNSGALYGPLLQDGRTHDRLSPFQTAPLPAGSLRLADLGYFSLAVLAEIAAQKAFFLSRLQAQTALFDSQGRRLALLALLRAQAGPRWEQTAQLGADLRLPVRLLVERVPPEVANRRRQRLREEARQRGQTVSQARLALADWTLVITNAPPTLLSLAQGLVLLRVRWQIELLFKLWKSQGGIDEWHSQDPWRILCEVYAKLIAMVLQHWLLLTGSWPHPNRSLVKAAQTVRSYAVSLASAIAGVVALPSILEQIDRCLAAGCRMNTRAKQPNTYQLLLALTDAS